jgi:hypothetical protein
MNANKTATMMMHAILNATESIANLLGIYHGYRGVWYEFEPDGSFRSPTSVNSQQIDKHGAGTPKSMAKELTDECVYVFYHLSLSLSLSLSLYFSLSLSLPLSLSLSLSLSLFPCSLLTLSFLSFSISLAICRTCRYSTSVRALYANATNPITERVLLEFDVYPLDYVLTSNGRTMEVDMVTRPMEGVNATQTLLEQWISLERWVTETGGFGFYNTTLTQLQAFLLEGQQQAARVATAVGKL